MKFGIRELIFVGLMLGLVLWSFLVFKRSDEKKQATEAKIQQKETALANLSRSTAGIDDLNRKLEELQKAIAFFENKLPPEKEVDKVLREVSEKAEKNSLQTKTVKPGKAERGPSYSEQPIQISLKGDFNGFYSFLLDLEKMQRITRVTQMNLQKIEDDGEMTAQITLSIFFEPDVQDRASDMQTASNR